jgi:hypothetical protein
MKSGGSCLRGSIVILLGASLAQGCSGSGRWAGSVGGACLAGGGCDDGLVCFSDICVQPAAADAGGGVGSEGIGGAAGAAGAGGAGGGAGMACTASATMLAPTSGLIADFMGADGGLEIAGELDTYPSGSTAVPTFSTATGVLHLTENAPATAAAQYLGIAIGFADCIDASAFTGVQFSISGSVSGCSIWYAAGDVEHQDPATDDYLATGPAGAYPPQTELTAPQVTAVPQTLVMPFTSSTIFGVPETPIDKTKLVLVLWQFDVPAGTPAPADGGAPACVADITIDNVTFY